MNAKQFGRLIKATREARGWSRTDLHRKSGVRLFSIYCIEEESRVEYPAETCKKLTDALGLAEWKQEKES